MRRFGAMLLATVVLLCCACGQANTEVLQPTVTVMRPSILTTTVMTMPTTVLHTEATEKATGGVTTPTDEVTTTTVSTTSTKALTTTQVVVTTTTTRKSTEVATTFTTERTTTSAAKKTITTTATTTASETTSTSVSETTRVTITTETACESDVATATDEGETTTTIATVITTTTATSSTVTPSADDEIRGAWVSYIEVAELLQRSSTPAQAKAAFESMMQRLAERRINTVFFHVRANSDAYYRSSVFQPAVAAEALLKAGFDPLEYAIQAAHKRGMTLHAWINPYRIGTKGSFAVKGAPTFTDAAGRYYYVPTSSKSQALILRGVREVLENYDVDGIQYDDYFYPERLLEENTVYGFESGDYEQYRNKGGKLSVGDWRRAGVDALIAGTHVLTSSHDVVFGVSPAVNADNTYTDLYANCRKWLAEEGFVDYLCPQIYTGFQHSNSPFDTTVDIWQSYPRHSSVELYVGLALYKIGLKSDTYAGGGKTEWRDHDDIMQRSVSCLRQKKIRGICLYSYAYLYPEDIAVPTFAQTNDVAVAKREVRNLLSVW